MRSDVIDPNRTRSRVRYLVAMGWIADHMRSP